MGRVIGVTIIVAGVVFAVVIGQRMSTDAMAVAVGVVFGVAASIPTSLLVVAATRSRREEGYRPRRDELRPPPPAPQIYVVAPGTQLGRPLCRGWACLAAIMVRTRPVSRPAASS